MIGRLKRAWRALRETDKDAALRRRRAMAALLIETEAASGGVVTVWEPKGCDGVAVSFRAASGSEWTGDGEDLYDAMRRRWLQVTARKGEETQA